MTADEDEGGGALITGALQRDKESADGVKLDKHGLVDTSILPTCPIAARNREQSPLLRLPPELRNRIFVYVFKVNTINVYRDLYGTDAPTIRGQNITYITTAIFLGEEKYTFAPTRTCRQVYEETRTLPYAMNTFHFQCADVMKVWISNCRPIQLKPITTVVLPAKGHHLPCGKDDPHHVAGRLKNMFPCLKVVYLLERYKTAQKTKEAIEEVEGPGLEVLIGCPGHVVKPKA